MWQHSSLRARSFWHFVSTKLADRQSAARALRVQRDAYYEHIWKLAASQIGASLELIGDGLLEIRRDDRITRVWKNYTSLDDPVTLRLAGNKPVVLRKLQALGIPVAPWTTFSLANLTPAEELLEGGTCVVKPARHTGAGSGISTGVRTAADLRRSAASAAAFDSLLQIERQMPGDNYRLLFLHGELVEVVRRDPPVVVGDGKSSIKSLIQIENLLRQQEGWRRAQTILSADEDMRRTLAAEGLQLNSVPGAGKSVVLKTVINENRAAENHVVDRVCPEVIAACRRCATELGIRLAGVDILSTDLSVPLEHSNGVVLEVNTTPGLYHHFDPDTESCRIAGIVLEAALHASPARESSRRSNLEVAE